MRQLVLACPTQRPHFDSAQCSQICPIVNENDYRSINLNHYNLEFSIVEVDLS